MMELVEAAQMKGVVRAEVAAAAVLAWPIGVPRQSRAIFSSCIRIIAGLDIVTAVLTD